MNQIEWQPKAARQLRKIGDKALQVRLYDAAQALKDFPACANVKKLTNHEYGYRLRVGDYRVFFDFVDTVKIVFIEEVKKRDERTY